MFTRSVTSVILPWPISRTTRPSYFPQKAFRFETNYSLYTDGFVHYKVTRHFSALERTVLAVIPISSRLALLPSLDTSPDPEKDEFTRFWIIGGDFQEDILRSNWRSPVSITSMLKFRCHLRVLQWERADSSNHYITLTTNVAANDDDFFHLYKGKYIWEPVRLRIQYHRRSLWGANFGISTGDEKFNHLDGYNF